MSELFTVPLNSFTRRTERTSELKSLIQKEGGQLKRIGRSRNWQLNVTRAQAMQVSQLVAQSDEQTWQWLRQAIEKTIPKANEGELIEIARAHWPLTVKELVALSDCSLMQARKVIDVLEWDE